jgi:hypothetical protein
MSQPVIDFITCLLFLAGGVCLGVIGTLHRHRDKLNA